MIGALFNKYNIGSNTILQFGFMTNSTPKASSKGEGNPPLIYIIGTISSQYETWSFPSCPTLLGLVRG